MQLIRKIKKYNKQKTKISAINQDTLTTVIPENNYWPEVDFYYLNHRETGPQNKPKGPLSYSNYIQISRRPPRSYNSSGIYNQTTDVRVAYTKLAHWYKLVEESGFKAFNIVARSITLNYKSILNYFINRSTNASAESFNAKIKAFRAQFRGVKNIEFFLYRLTNIFA
jgi:hypothetical protein